jgi:hypothetical protein
MSFLRGMTALLFDSHPMADRVSLMGDNAHPSTVGRSDANRSYFSRGAMLKRHINTTIKDLEQFLHHGLPERISFTLMKAIGPFPPFYA